MPIAGVTLSLGLAGVAASAMRAGAVASAAGLMGAGAGMGSAREMLEAGAAAQRLARLAGTASVAVAALSVFAAAVKNAAESLQGFGQQQLSLAATGIETAMLRTLGRAFGAGDIGSAGARLHAASLQGLGTATAVRFGIPIRPAEVGTATNRGDMLIRALEGLRETFRTQGMGAAIAAARNLNIEDWLQVVYLTNEQMGRLRKQAEQQSGIFSQENIARATQLKFEVVQLASAWEAMVVSIGSKLIPAIQTVTYLLNQLTSISLPGSSFLDQALRIARGEGPEAAVNGNTKALQDNTRALDYMNGMYGLGPRGRAAIPRAFGPGAGFMLNDTLRTGSATRYGAYSAP